MMSKQSKPRFQRSQSHCTSGSIGKPNNSNSDIANVISSSHTLKSSFAERMRQAANQSSTDLIRGQEVDIGSKQKQMPGNSKMLRAASGTVSF